MKTQKKILSLLLLLCIFLSAFCVFAENERREYSPQEAVNALGSFYKMYPVYGEDTNVVDIMRADLEKKGYSGADISIR